MPGAIYGTVKKVGVTRGIVGTKGGIFEFRRHSDPLDVYISFNKNKCAQLMLLYFQNEDLTVQYNEGEKVAVVLAFERGDNAYRVELCCPIRLIKVLQIMFFAVRLLICFCPLPIGVQLYCMCVVMGHN